MDLFTVLGKLFWNLLEHHEIISYLLGNSKVAYGKFWRQGKINFMIEFFDQIRIYAYFVFIVFKLFIELGFTTIAANKRDVNIYGNLTLYGQFYN